MRRRTFIKLCTSSAALIAARPQALAAPAGPATAFDRVRLTTADGSPLRASDLDEGETYVFHYPYISTPCFLLQLGKTVPQQPALHTAEGGQYAWQGGVGPQGNIVAFSAICTHLMTHPTPKLSFIHYYHDRKSEIADRAGVITCCAHGSVFDPAQGARVVGGPATQPLTTILLEYDTVSQGLHATGTLGADLYRDFFKAFKRELRGQFGRGAAKQRVSETSIVQRLSDYSAQPIDC